MAESRRVPLTTLSCGRPSFSDVLVPSGGMKENLCDRSKTVRLELKLFQPDEQKFPEFNYRQLLDDKTKKPEDHQLNGFQQKEKEENDEVASIARKFEEKYGGMYKKDRIQDLIDIGYGYDDEDSFIDNSEAYDEFVPSSITTKFGGFYVNSGLLQFRKASDSESEDIPTNDVSFDFTKNKPKKKRCQASQELKSNPGLKMRGLTKAASEDSKVRKKKRTVRALSVTSMLRKFEREKERQNMEEAKRVTAVISAPKASLFPADAAGSGGPALTDPLLSLIGSTNDHALIQAANTVDFDIDLDSLLDASEETLSPESSFPTAETSQTKVNGQTQSKVTCDHEVQHQEAKITSQLKPHLEAVQILMEQSSGSAPCAPLPEGLPPALEENIGKLIEAARTSEGESKLKFFSPDINSVLLDIELQCQEQSGQLRSKVYTHLSSFLPCSRDTLLKRVRKLIKQLEEPVYAEEPMQKLKESIGRSMPEQVASFNESCRAYEETKFLKMAEEDNVEERAGRKGGPKKLFKWNEEIRECLSHVLKEKSDKYKKEGKGDQEIEEFLKTFLENEVKALWPKGWMQSRVLLRESKKRLGLFHSLLGNKGRCLKKQSTGGASKTSDVCSSFYGVPLRSELDPRVDSGLNGSSQLSSGVPKYQRDEGTATPLAPKMDGPPDQTASESLVSRLCNRSGQEVTSEQPPALSQELLTEAFAKHWSTETEVNRPLLPPAPQPSPVGFPGNQECQIVFPHLLKIGDPSRLDRAQMLVISDSEAVYNLNRVQEGLST
ncbi:ubinuclein-1 isoform X2 [Oryzias melastigma]|uniref:ubinuclein-1 isoform X2 n=1 Tax=Oryzias melastigma TaxID=30732 RepID=UPI000CF7FA0F|nr:ubinuclein-1 isoform X2 [Oryzias melastigma]